MQNQVLKLTDWFHPIDLQLLFYRKPSHHPIALLGGQNVENLQFSTSHWNAEDPFHRIFQVRMK